MRTTTKAKIGLAGLGATALTLAATLPAFADYAPGPSDIVGVGGDTPQYDLAFGADGSASGTVGFNSSHPLNKLVPFLATADGNARAASDASGNTLNPTVVLRAGTSPVQRIPSSGAAISALIADTKSPHRINFIFSASLPTSVQQGLVPKSWGYLHSVEIGKDAVIVAKDTTSNAPANLTIATLLKIYNGTWTHWNQVPGGTSTDAIIPELPPTSSSIYKTFVKDLTAVNGNVAPVFSGTTTVQQNDPTAITGAARSADAILPFSSARLKLEQSGYFSDPSLPFPGGAGVKPKVVSDVSTTSKTGYKSEVDHYVIFRQSDEAIKTPMEPGSSLNWVYTLFAKSKVKGSPVPFFDTAAGKADIAAAGSSPAYKDLGNASSG